ncbi:MAG: helix-turn-helix domain-containing protein [Gammaproteobacteria bacterium]
MQTMLEGQLARKLDGAETHIPASDCQSLRECLCMRLKDYFHDLDDHPAGKLHELVMSEVEAPLLEIVVHHADGNLSRAAEILGMHRATLRRKLDHYGIA